MLIVDTIVLNVGGRLRKILVFIIALLAIDVTIVRLLPAGVPERLRLRGEFGQLVGLIRAVSFAASCKR